MIKFKTKVIDTKEGTQVEFAIGSQVFHLQEQCKKDLIYTEGLPLRTYSEIFRGHLEFALDGLTKKGQLNLELLKEKPYLLQNHIIINDEKIDVPINDPIQLLETVLKHLGYGVDIKVNE